LAEKRTERVCEEARPTSSGSHARWREEVMPGGTSGEVMRRKASAEVMLARSRQEQSEEPLNDLLDL